MRCFFLAPLLLACTCDPPEGVLRLESPSEADEPVLLVEVDETVGTMLHVDLEGVWGCAPYTVTVQADDQTRVVALDAGCAGWAVGLPPDTEVRVLGEDSDGGVFHDELVTTGPLPSWAVPLSGAVSGWGYTFTSRDGQPVVLGPDGTLLWWAELPEGVVGLEDMAASRVLPRVHGGGVLVLVEGAGGVSEGPLDTGADPESHGVVLELDWDGTGTLRGPGSVHDDMVSMGGGTVQALSRRSLSGGPVYRYETLVGDGPLAGWSTAEDVPDDAAGTPECVGLAWSPERQRMAVSCPGFGGVAVIETTVEDTVAFLGGELWTSDDPRTLDVFAGRMPLRPTALAWTGDGLLILDEGGSVGEGVEPARLVELAVDLDEGTAAVLWEGIAAAPLTGRGSAGGGVAWRSDGSRAVAWGETGIIEQYGPDGTLRGSLDLGGSVGRLHVVEDTPFD